MRRFRAEECGIFLSAKCPDDGFEHQIEFAWVGERADRFGIRPKYLRQSIDLGQRNQFSGPRNPLGLFGPQVKEFECAGVRLRKSLLPSSFAGNKYSASIVFRPASSELIVSVAFFGFPAIDHKVVKQVIVPRTLPYLRMHDDRAIESGHIVSRRCAHGRFEFIVTGDHVAPPGFFDIALQFNTQRPVVPKSLEATVNVARLKEKSASFAERNEFIHIHPKAPLLAIEKRVV